MRVVVIRMHTLDLPGRRTRGHQVEPREGQPATRCIANGTRGTTSPKRNTSDNLSWTSEARLPVDLRN